MAKTFLTAEWRKLVMAQYSVRPEVLAAYLPPGTELDLYHGECFVSLIGFLFDKVRIKGIAIPFHTRFEEVNLRFYVRRREPDGTQKRGVVFVREIVPLPAISVVANVLYEEPYATMPMRREIRHDTAALRVRYEWKHGGRWASIAAEGEPVAAPIDVGSVEEFITEHYWGYTLRRHGGTSQYEVHHPRWAMYGVRGYDIKVDFGALYGPAFAMLNGVEPANVLLAEGSAVSVDEGTRLAAG
jgi:uncharacterized protein YqjF (DUF2071 family)